MLSRANVKARMIGNKLPYVFINSVVLGPARPLMSDEIFVKTESPRFRENFFGSKELVAGQEPDFDKGASTFSATITLSMNDLLERSVWFNTPMRSLIRVKVLYATSIDAYEYIKTSSVRDITQIPRRLKRFIKSKDFQIPTDKPLRFYSTKQVNDFSDTLCTITMRERFVVKGNFLGFVAFPYVEAQGLYGQKTSQKALENGKTNFVSYSFYSQDGSAWNGPVHRHPSKGFMEGAVHSDRPHGLLTAVPSVNKVRDQRIFTKFSSIQNEISLSKNTTRKEKVYSDIFLSSDRSGIVRGLFAFNIMKFLEEEGEFNNLFTTRNRKKLLTLSLIESMKVFRLGSADPGSNKGGEADVMVKRNLSKEVVAQTAQRSIYSKVASSVNKQDRNADGVQERTVGSIREISMSGVGTNRVFSFVDFEVANLSGGTFNYGVEFTIKDPTKKFLKMRLKSLKRARKIILSYYEEAKNPRNFNRITGNFTDEYLNSLSTIYNLDPTSQKSNKSATLPWRVPVHLYVDTLQDLVGRRVLKADVLELQKQLYPASGNLSGVEYFISLLDSLIQNLSKYDMAADEITSRSSGGRKNVSVRDRLETKNIFLNQPWNASRHANKKVYLNYLKGALQKDQFGMPRVNKNSLVNRFNVEAGKYFPEVVGKNESQVSDPSLKGFRKIYQNFLTPTTLENADGQEVVVSKKDEESFDKAALLLKSSGESSGSKSDEAEAILAAAGVKVKRRKKRKKGRGDATRSDSKGFLGENTKFTTKVTNKDSSQQEIVDPEKTSEQRSIEKDLVYGRGQQNRVKDGEVANRDGIPIRYLKMLRKRRRERLESQSTDEQQAVEIEQKEEIVLDTTTASVKYITGFGKGMEPIYSQRIPTSSKDVILVVDNGDDQDGIAVNDSVVIVTTSGESVSEERLKEEDPCEDKVFVTQEVERDDSTKEDPSPTGYTYQEETETSIETEIVLVSSTPEDVPAHDVQTEQQSVVEELPPQATETREPQSAPVRTRDSASAAQQEGYFVRRPERRESRRQQVDTAPSTTTSTPRTSGGSSGTGGSYGY